MRLIRRITCLRDEFGKTIKVKFISYIKKFMNYQKKKKNGTPFNMIRSIKKFEMDYFNKINQLYSFSYKSILYQFLI